MKNNLPCEIVRDLLPSYIDDISSEKTKEAVKDHIEECEGCRRAYEVMKGLEDIHVDMEDKAEIDFLKANRSKGRNRTAMAIIVTLAVILLVFGYRGYVAGETCDPSLINYQLSVGDESVDISGNMIECDQGVKKVTYSYDNGTLNIDVSTTGASFIYGPEFNSSYIPEGEIDRIILNDRMIIWCDGEYISPKVSDIFMNRNEYIGDNVKDAALADAAGIADVIGSYTSELQTDTEPYGWRLVSDMDLEKKDAEEIKDRFSPYAVILLATVDNLGYVEWEYTCDGKKKVVKITEEDANSLIAQYAEDKPGNVKEYGASASALQEMIDFLPIYDFSFTSGNLGRYIGGDISIDVCNETDCEIYGISIGVLVNGEEVSSGESSNADETALEKGDVMNMAVPAEGSIDDPAKDKIAVKIGVVGRDGNGYDAGIIDLGTVDGMKDRFKEQYNGGTGIFEFEAVVTGTYDGGFEMELK